MFCKLCTVSIVSITQILSSLTNITVTRYFSRGKINMGIHGLTKLLADNAPSAMKENEMKNYFGKI